MLQGVDFGQVVREIGNKLPGCLSAMVLRRKDHLVVAGKTDDVGHTPQEIGIHYMEMWNEIQREILSSWESPATSLKRIVMLSDELNVSVALLDAGHVLCVESVSPKSAAHMLCLPKALDGAGEA